MVLDFISLNVNVNGNGLKGINGLKASSVSLARYGRLPQTVLPSSNASDSSDSSVHQSPATSTNHAEIASNGQLLRQ